MANLTLRSVKGSPLTNAELDGNFEYFTGSHAITGSLTISGSIIPIEANGTLGTAQHPWKELFIDGATIVFISGSSSGSISFTSGSGFNFVGGNLNISGSPVVTNTGSFATTGSNSFNGNQTITGSVTSTGGFTGSLIGTATTASYVSPTFISASAAAAGFGSGGGSTIDTGSFATTGSNTFNGNQTITGSITSTGGFTGSLQGTATTASFVTTAQTASYVATAQTASYVATAQTASYVATASYAVQALSASWAPSTGGSSFPYTGSALITGSLGITGSLTQQNGSVSLGFPATFNRNLDIWTNAGTDNVVLAAGDSSSKPYKVQLNPVGANLLITSNDTSILMDDLTDTITISGSVLLDRGITGSLEGTASFASYAATSSLSNTTLGAGDAGNTNGGEIQIRGNSSGDGGRNTYASAFSYNFAFDGLNIGDPNTTGGYGSGIYYLAVGYDALAAGFAAAFGSSSYAQSEGSFTHGKAVTAAGTYSHAEGLGTIASGSYQHVQGRYNTQGDTTSLMIVGNGTTTNARKDAFKVRMSGSIVLPTTQSTAPSWTGTDGEMVFATVTGNHRFYVWMSGAWRSGSLS